MHRFYLCAEELQAGEIKSEEFNHLKNVLRMKEKDKFVAICNNCNNYFCTIDKINKNSANFTVDKIELNEANPKFKLAIFQGLAKGEKLELVAQKATEIGVSSIFPTYFSNCDVKPYTNKISRLEKICISACKQCGRSIVPQISDCVTIKDLPNLLKNYDICLLANEREDNKQLLDILNEYKNVNSVAVIVGPEGGFSTTELEILKSYAISVSLGKRILRTETAGVYLMSVLSSFYGA